MTILHCRIAMSRACKPVPCILFPAICVWWLAALSAISMCMMSWWKGGSIERVWWIFAFSCLIYWLSIMPIFSPHVCTFLQCVYAAAFSSLLINYSIPQTFPFWSTNQTFCIGISICWEALIVWLYGCSSLTAMQCKPFSLYSYLHIPISDECFLFPSFSPSILSLSLSLPSSTLCCFLLHCIYFCGHHLYCCRMNK